MIIPFFIMNRGCHHRCIFCNERLTAGGDPDRLTEELFGEAVRRRLDSGRRKSLTAEIAFYGGTFTAMPRDEQTRLLEMAAPFLKSGVVGGIRISTRPDEIDTQRLDLLKRYGVTVVEIGAQSFDDEVLRLTRRGHTASHVERSLSLLKAAGFRTGIHLMAGLPGDSEERFTETIERTIAQRPDMVRIHPVIVLKDTALAEEYRRGAYEPLTLSAAVERCKQALRKLDAARIPVIRMGLQTTAEMEEPGAVVAGPFHPAFRSLVESALIRERAVDLLAATPHCERNVRFALAPADLSSFYGQGRTNLSFLKNTQGLQEIHVLLCPSLPRRTLALVTHTGSFLAHLDGSITPIPEGRLQGGG
jgi:histone acetyltransferase (RNA polymerase elongator complex component)